MDFTKELWVSEWEIECVLMHVFMCVSDAITVNLKLSLLLSSWVYNVCVYEESAEKPVYWLTSWCFCWRHACDVRQRNVLDTYIWRVMLMVHRINYPNSLCAGNSRRVVAAAAVVVSAAGGVVMVLKLSETITIVEMWANE